MGQCNDEPAITMCGCGDECRCEEALAHVYEYLDAEMAPEILTKIRQHFDGCEDCEKELEYARHLKAAVQRSCCSDCAPQELRLRIVEQMEVWNSQNGVIVSSSRETFLA